MTNGHNRFFVTKHSSHKKVNTTVLDQNVSIETRLKSFQAGEVDAVRWQPVPHLCNTNCKELMSYTGAECHCAVFIAS